MGFLLWKGGLCDLYILITFLMDYRLLMRGDIVIPLLNAKILTDLHRSYCH